MSEIAILKYLLAFYAGAGMCVVAASLLIKKSIGRLAGVFLASCGLLGALFVDAYLVEPNWIQTRHIKIHDSALAGVLAGLKIVQITDIHLARGIGFREQQMIEKVNALKPDLIFFTGDLLDDWNQLGAAQELIQSLKAKVGIYGVPGDTDLMVMNSQEFASRMAPAGMDVILNQSRKLKLPDGKLFWLAGLDGSRPENLNRALAQIPAGAPVLVLAPSPDIFEEAIRQKVNLVLVGDTHGGQFGIDWIVRLSEYANRSPYMRGLFKKEKTQMYVNRGIGTKTRPMRFLCRPEIAVFKVTP